jgi:hypothetical protein
MEWPPWWVPSSQRLRTPTTRWTRGTSSSARWALYSHSSRRCGWSIRDILRSTALGEKRLTARGRGSPAPQPKCRIEPSPAADRYRPSQILLTNAATTVPLVDLRTQHSRIREEITRPQHPSWSGLASSLVPRSRPSRKSLHHTAGPVRHRRQLRLERPVSSACLQLALDQGMRLSPRRTPSPRRRKPSRTQVGPYGSSMLIG